MTSSKSSSWQLVGDSRSCARSGRWTMTVCSVPTSEETPMAGEVEGADKVTPLGSGSTQGGRAADEQEGYDERRRGERPHELEVAVVADLREGEAAHDHRGRRRDQVHEAG